MEAVMPFEMTRLVLRTDCLAYSSTMKTEAGYSSETSLNLLGYTALHRRTCCPLSPEWSADTNKQTNSVAFSPQANHTD
jgi:hypothetical protein